MTRSWPRSGRHPFQIALLAVSLVSGLAGLLLSAPAPSSGVSLAFGKWAPIFYLALLVAAALGLTGGFWRAANMRALQVGLQIERAGMPLLAGTSGAYAVLTVTAGGLRALLAVLLIGGIALAALVRTRQISRELADIRIIIDRDDDA